MVVPLYFCQNSVLELLVERGGGKIVRETRHSFPTIFPGRTGVRILTEIVAEDGAMSHLLKARILVASNLGFECVQRERCLLGLRAGGPGVGGAIG